MTTTLELRVRPEVAYDAARLRSVAAERLDIAPREITHVRIVRRSIDARQRNVMVNLGVQIWVGEQPTELAYTPIRYGDVARAPRPSWSVPDPRDCLPPCDSLNWACVPWCSSEVATSTDEKRTLPPLHVPARSIPRAITPSAKVARGAFSDGKLYTRSKKRGNVARILGIFCQHGAATDILADAHPHIGTDRLPGIIAAMRRQIIESGGEVHFRTRVDALLFSADGQRVEGVRTAGGDEWKGPVVLATGHSARDVYRYLHAAGVEIEQKGVAMGVRLEHPAHLIDQIQYHNREGRGRYLPAAEYAFVQQVNGRGVYSFCMCPGGFVVPAATGPEQLVVNGMSPANRGSRWSNSGMVVETRPEDLNGGLAPWVAEALQNEALAEGHAALADEANPLRMMWLQESIERAAWVQGGRTQAAPAQRMADFVNNRLSAELPKSSYNAGLIASPLHFWMPRFITERLQEGFKAFGRRSRGFLTDEAILIAAETRTSSPVRVVRDHETLQHVRLSGLFPCGEGAGYAGGIVSAAMDGERCAEALAASLGL